MLKRILITTAVLMTLAGLATWLYWQDRAAPSLVQLLPEADAIGYLDLRPLRLATGFGSRQTLSRAPEYEEFVRSTGFEFERDLDEFALAVHRVGEAGDTRYSQIFRGRWDAKRLEGYLHKIAANTEHYGKHDIYLIPYEGRTVRVVILAPDRVAVSNTTSALSLLAIIDKFHQMSFFRRGPQILRDYRERVPEHSILWAILKIGSLSDETDFTMPLPGGFDLTLPSHSVLIASVTYAGGARLRAEALTEDDEEAKRISDHLGTVISVYRQVSKPTDKDLRAVFDSIRAAHEDHRAVFTAMLPKDLLTRVIADAPMTPASSPEKASAPSPVPTATKGSNKTTHSH